VESLADRPFAGLVGALADTSSLAAGWRAWLAAEKPESTALPGDWDAKVGAGRARTDEGLAEQGVGILMAWYYMIWRTAVELSASIAGADTARGAAPVRHRAFRR